MFFFTVLGPGKEVKMVHDHVMGRIRRVMGIEVYERMRGRLKRRWLDSVREDDSEKGVSRKYDKDDEKEEQSDSGYDTRSFVRRLSCDESRGNES